MAELEVWVDQFRNNASIVFEYSIGSILPEAEGAQYLGELVSGNMFREEVSNLKLSVEASASFFLYFTYVSSSGMATKSCFAVVPLSMEANRRYKIEFINWRPKEALFSNFVCELDFGLIQEDGTVSRIEYYYVEPNKARSRTFTN